MTVVQFPTGRFHKFTTDRKTGLLKGRPGFLPDNITNLSMGRTDNDGYGGIIDRLPPEHYPAAHPILTGAIAANNGYPPMVPERLYYFQLFVIGIRPQD